MLPAVGAVPVIGRAMALQRRLERLQDAQLFVSASAAPADFASLKRSLEALTVQVQALTAGFAAVRAAFSSFPVAILKAQAADLRTAISDLRSVLR